MSAKLVAAEDWIDIREIVLTKLPLTIGRGADVDVPLADRWVSGRHCELFEMDGRLGVRDLGSRNGTLINGAYVKQSVMQPGVKLTVGLTSFVLHGVPCDGRAIGNG